MAGEMAGGLIAGGLSLSGSIISDLLNRENVEEQLAFQREAQQNAIQWRVADAEKAGIHPIFALGANTPTSFPVAMDTRIGEGMRDMGQSLGGAIARTLDNEAKEKHQMDMALGAAQLEESDARKQMYLSEAARNRQQPGNPIPGLGVQKEGSQGRVTVGPEIEVDGQTFSVPGTGAIDVKPVDQLSAKEGRPDVAAGEHPGYKEFRYRGMPMLLPETAGESAEEIVSEMSTAAYLGLLSLNNKVYGGNWLRDFLNLRYAGNEPKEYYPTLNEQKRMGRMNKGKSTWQEFINKLP